MSINYSKPASYSSDEEEISARYTGDFYDNAQKFRRTVEYAKDAAGDIYNIADNTYPVQKIKKLPRVAVKAAKRTFYAGKTIVANDAVKEETKVLQPSGQCDIEPEYNNCDLNLRDFKHFDTIVNKSKVNEPWSEKDLSNIIHFCAKLQALAYFFYREENQEMVRETFQAIGTAGSISKNGAVFKDENESVEIYADDDKEEPIESMPFAFHHLESGDAKKPFGYLTIIDRTAIIAVRGTSNLMDWVTNAKFKKNSDKFHRGFAEKANLIYYHLLDHLIQYKKAHTAHSVKNILVLGHSQGAGIAQLLMRDLMLAFQLTDISNMMTFTLCTFSSPRIADKETVGANLARVDNKQEKQRWIDVGAFIKKPTDYGDVITNIPWSLESPYTLILKQPDIEEKLKGSYFMYNWFSKLTREERYLYEKRYPIYRAQMRTTVHNTIWYKGKHGDEHPICLVGNCDGY